MSARGSSGGADGLTVQVGRRDFSALQGLGGVAWTVDSLTWRAVGGPRRANLRAAARSAGELWALADLLRCPITVRDRLGPAWWGYVSAVEIQDGARWVRISLDEMANSVRTAYRDYSPHLPGGAGELRQSPWQTDAVSAEIYGLKQASFALGPALPAEAQAFADAQLRRCARPRVTTGAQDSASDITATVYTARVECRGWWETLDWQFYQQPRGRLDHRLSGAGQPVGGAAANLNVAQPILLDQTQACGLGELWLRLRKTGSPADALKAQVCRDNGGIPGALIDESAVECSAVGADWDWVRFVFEGAPLPAGETLWLVLSRTGAPDAAHHCLCSADESPSQPFGPLMLYDGSAWSPRVPAANLSFILNGVEETTRQIADMLAAPRGQFFSGVRIETAPGGLAWVYRAGDARARAEIERLLEQGTADGLRLLARVEADRTVRVYPQPSAASAGLKIDPRGEIVRADGRRLLPSEWPAGQWARLDELSAAGGLAAVDAATWIEGCGWKEGGFEGRSDE